MIKLKKILVLFLILIISAVQTVPVIAIDAPTAPSAPSAPEAPLQPSAPSAPADLQSVPQNQEPQQQESETSNESSPTPSDSPLNNQEPENQIQNSSPSPSPSPSLVSQNSPSPSPASSSAQNGDTFVKTGDANNTGNISTTGNQNMQSSDLPGVESNGTSIANIGNGSNTDNNSSASLNSNTNTNQNNSALVDNNLNLSTVTGKNSATDNVGDSIVKTGDANVTGTVLTHLNTNVEGVSVSEFNIADDHKGDYVLDFASGCISGCQSFNPALVANIDNGTNSQNNANVDFDNNSNTFQHNDANVESNLVLKADSGNNLSSRNTGGDSFIETGNANVAANALTFINNNLSGNVLYGVVNIFGDLIGNLVLPESVLNQGSCQSCNDTATAGNFGNGAGSQNTADIEQNTNNSTFQTNVAEIENNLMLDSQTGNNDTSKNTGGVSYANTGNSSADAKVLNIANSNINGGNWWLVIVNEAGNWIGKIMGAPEGNNFAGSQGTEIGVNEKGEITAVNKGNGSDSKNETDITQNTNTTTVQTNTAKVKNNLNLSANTGNNQASYNTGGDSVVKTGDANILANIVNFVNNNITGGGKLLVTLVNVFGSWQGDFVTPGQTSSPTPSPTPSPNTGSSGGIGEGTGETPSSTPLPTPSGNNSSEEEENDSTGSQPTGSSTSFEENNSETASNSSGNPAAFNTQVAGFSTIVEGADAEIQFPFTGKGKGAKIKINLAWLLVIVPSVALSYVVYKKIKLLQLRSKVI